MLAKDSSREYLDSKRGLTTEAQGVDRILNHCSDDLVDAGRLVIHHIAGAAGMKVAVLFQFIREGLLLRSQACHEVKAAADKGMGHT